MRLQRFKSLWWFSLALRYFWIGMTVPNSSSMTTAESTIFLLRGCTWYYHAVREYFFWFMVFLKISEKEGPQHSHSSIGVILADTNYNWLGMKGTSDKWGVWLTWHLLGTIGLLFMLLLGQEVEEGPMHPAHIQVKWHHYKQQYFHENGITLGCQFAG